MTEGDLSKLRIDKTRIPARRGKNKRYVLLALALLLLIVLGILYRKGFLTPAADVRVGNVQEMYPSQTFTLLNASGYVVAQRKAAVASKITGRLVHLAVEEGSRVKAGEVIARLENDDALAARDRARANVTLASHNLDESRFELDDSLRAYKRRKQVVGQGYVSELEFDAAEARYRKADAALAARQAALQASEAALREAEVNVEYANIRAPFDAVVLTKNADIGDIVTPLGAAANAKAAVVTIADMNSLLVEVDVSESNIAQVEVGQPCEIQLDALPGSRFPGAVHMIVPTADRSKASVMVKVAFEEKDARILPEMSAKVAFLSRAASAEEQKPVTVVPAQAIVSHQQRHYVFVVRDKRAVKTVVRLGRNFGTVSEALEGVQVGDRVVLEPGKLKDRSKVQISEE